MRKIPLNTAILTGALVVFLALPSAASAGQIVPPGNSAATQYTQVFPTSGGNVAVGKSIGEPGGGKGRTPDKVIGKKTTKELEAQGPEGAAVAELAAESAPETEPETSQGSSEESSSGGGGKGGKHPNGDGHKQQAQGAGDGPGKQAGGGAKSQQPASNAGAASSADTAAAEAAGSGTSGVSSVLGQATGATSGQMGAFLPLILLASLVVALAYAWWRRQHEQRAAS